jgi:hypothetical protein
MLLSRSMNLDLGRGKGPFAPTRGVAVLIHSGIQPCLGIGCAYAHRLG